MIDISLLNECRHNEQVTSCGSIVAELFEQRQLRVAVSVNIIPVLDNGTCFLMAITIMIQDSDILPTGGQSENHFGMTDSPLWSSE